MIATLKKSGKPIEATITDGALVLSDLSGGTYEADVTLDAVPARKLTYMGVVAVHVVRCSDLTVRVRYRGNNLNAIAIGLENCTNVTIERCDIRDVGVCNGAIASIGGRNNKCLDNLIYRTGGQGMWIGNVNTDATIEQNPTIRGNTLIDTGHTAIGTHSASALLELNAISGVGLTTGTGSGIKAGAGSTRFTAKQNIVERVAWQGFQDDGTNTGAAPTDIEVADNIFTNCGHCGVYLVRASGSVTNNEGHQCGDWGIRLLPESTVTQSGNDFTGNVKGDVQDD